MWKYVVVTEKERERERLAVDSHALGVGSK